MSAIGTKRTSIYASQCPLLGVKRTSRGFAAMFANDPERTSPRLINARNSANYERKTLCNALQKELAFSASDFCRSSCRIQYRRS